MTERSDALPNDPGRSAAGTGSQADDTDVDDIPELTEADIAAFAPMTADLGHLAVLKAAQSDLRRRRGPQKTATRERISIRLDRDLVAHFRSSGAGWQKRLNAALRAAVLGKPPA